MANAGRKTSFKESHIETAMKYIDDYESYGDAMPMVEGLAEIFGVTRQTIYNWAKEHTLFFDTLERLKSKQLRVLNNKGLSGDFNPTITKLVLSANHGYTERTDSTIRGSGGGPVEFKFVDPPNKPDADTE